MQFAKRNFHSLQKLFQSFCVLASYGFVSGIFHNADFITGRTYPNGVSLVFNFLVQIAIVKSGSDLTEEAGMASVIISKIMNEFHFSESQKIDFMFFITQVKARKVDVQNSMFTINWKLLLAVSFSLSMTH